MDGETEGWRDVGMEGKVREGWRGGGMERGLLLDLFSINSYK